MHDFLGSVAARDTITGVKYSCCVIRNGVLLWFWL